MIILFRLPFGLDVSDRSGGSLVYVKSYIPLHQLIRSKTPSNIQVISFEINLRKENWFFLSIHKPPLQGNQDFLDSLSEINDYYSNVYDNHIILGDFDMDPSQTMFSGFMNTHNYTKSVFYWQFLINYIFSVSLKFRAYYITGQWGKFRVMNATF